jgi:hypothetical protein
MSTIETLQALAAGKPVVSGAVLQHARLAGFGRQYYGEEEIVEHFRRLPLGEGGRILGSPAHAALLWDDRVLFADLAGDHIMRLWRLGPGEPAAAGAQISVPFDPDMTQARGDVILRGADHPALATSDVAALGTAGSELARGWIMCDSAPAMRARAFCVRAFSTGDEAVGLFAVYGLSGSDQRQAGFVHALVVTGRDRSLVPDTAGMDALLQTQWRPRAG